MRNSDVVGKKTKVIWNVICPECNYAVRTENVVEAVELLDSHFRESDHKVDLKGEIVPDDKEI